jgi:hypothetical protein
LADNSREEKGEFVFEQQTKEVMGKMAVINPKPPQAEGQSFGVVLQNSLTGPNKILPGDTAELITRLISAKVFLA